MEQCSEMLLRARFDPGVEGLVSYRRVELVERVQEGLQSRMSSVSTVRDARVEKGREKVGSRERKQTHLDVSFPDLLEEQPNAVVVLQLV